MAFTRIDGVLLHYRLDGTPGGRKIVFSNSLGSDFRIWDDVVALLPADYEVLRYDKRGHGLSDAPPAPYTIEAHASDLRGLLAALGWKETALVGLSVGGMIAQSIAASAPDLVSSLVLCDTAAKIGTAEMWDQRIAAVEASGIAPIGAAVIARWFTEGFARNRPDALAGWRLMLERTPADGYAGTCAAIRDADLSAMARTIAAPTLCLVGDGDLSTPPDLVRATAGLIPGARFEIVADAGHLPCIERPQAMRDLIVKHLETPHG